MPAGRRLAAFVSVAVASGVLAGVTITAQSTPASAAVKVSNTQTYAVNRPMCSEPADPNAARCFGLKQQIVPRGTAGAYRLAAHGAQVRTALQAVDGSPAGLAAAYHFNPRVNRRNITVGIVLWHDAPNVLNDLNVFNRQNRLPAETAATFRKVNADGKARPLPQRDRGTSSEVALDTQAVRGVCNTCRILLVEASHPYGNDLAKAVNTAVRLGASIVTNSYGVPEHRMSAAFRNAYNHPGVAILASTGDSGWYGWDYANQQGYASDSAPSFPATSPSVIAVGGTTLLVDSAGRRSRETVWNNNGDADSAGRLRNRPLGASGGGCSKLFTAPLWQRLTRGYAAAGCGGKRLAADLALVADPYTGYHVYDSYGSGGWITVGGTSLSSPIAAGMLALAGGPKGARYPATALYGRGSARYDITAGGNAYCGAAGPTVCSTATYTAGGTNNPNKLGRGLLDCTFSRSGAETIPGAASSECTATPGFDGPSGVGAPASPALFARTDPYLGIRVKGKIAPKKTKKFSVKISTPVRATAIRSLRWNWGDKKTTSTLKRTVSHKYRKSGRYTVTVTSVDSRGQTAVVQKRITVR